MKIKEISKKYGAVHIGKNLDTGNQNTGGDMVRHGYDKFYEKHFSSKRDSEEITLLEIGVFRGGGLVIWSDYFSKGRIYGVDIGIQTYLSNVEAYKSKGGYSNDNIVVCKGDSTDISTWDSAISEFPLMDFIIDDGLHNPAANQATFENFWDKLKEGGIYVIEDIRPNHLTQVESYLDNKNLTYQIYTGNLGESIAFISK